MTMMTVMLIVGIVLAPKHNGLDGQICRNKTTAFSFLLVGVGLGKLYWKFDVFLCSRLKKVDEKLFSQPIEYCITKTSTPILLYIAEKPE